MAAVPKKTGFQTLQLPLVKYQRDGVTTHRFSPPEINIDVRPLPLFVPPTMPIGVLTIQMDKPESFFLIRDELELLTLRIQTDGNNVMGHSHLLRQFSSGEKLSFYPSQVTDGKGIGLNERVYQIPMEPRRMGLLSMPSIRVQYFDPLSGKIKTVDYSLGWYLVVNWWVVYLSIAVASLSLLLVIVRIYRFLKYKYRKLKLYRSAEQGILHAETVEEMKLGLKLVSGLEGWPENITLASWLSRWQARYGDCKPVSEGISKLQQKCYAHVDIPVDEIKHLLVSICYHQMPILKFSRRVTAYFNSFRM
jgi:hypothetical protein